MSECFESYEPHGKKRLPPYDPFSLEALIEQMDDIKHMSIEEIEARNELALKKMRESR